MSEVNRFEAGGSHVRVRIGNYEIEGSAINNNAHGELVDKIAKPLYEFVA